MTRIVPIHKKRLQIFISSTYTDLREERQAAVEAILTAGHIPAGMELFTAGDETQMHVIKEWIDESDVFMLILGSRYGSMEPTKDKSYTHLEYEYAVANEKPVFAAVLDDKALDERVRRMGNAAVENENPAKLRQFREQVLTRMVRLWTDIKDIKLTVHETMARYASREDLRGWVRASDDMDAGALAAEITRLTHPAFRKHSEFQDFKEWLTASSEIWLAGKSLRYVLNNYQKSILETLAADNSKKMRLLIHDADSAELIHISTLSSGSLKTADRMRDQLLESKEQLQKMLPSVVSGGLEARTIPTFLAHSITLLDPNAENARAIIEHHFYGVPPVERLHQEITPSTDYFAFIKIKKEFNDLWEAASVIEIEGAAR